MGARPVSASPSCWRRDREPSRDQVWAMRPSWRRKMATSSTCSKRRPVGVAEPGAEVGGRAGEPADDRVALGDPPAGERLVAVGHGLLRRDVAGATPGTATAPRASAALTRVNRWPLGQSRRPPSAPGRDGRSAGPPARGPGWTAAHDRAAHRAAALAQPGRQATACLRWKRWSRCTKALSVGHRRKSQPDSCAGIRSSGRI